MTKMTTMAVVDILSPPSGILGQTYAPLSHAAEKVRLERIRADTDFPKFRHDVEVRCTLLRRETLSNEGGVNTRRKVRIFAASIGADTVAGVFQSGRLSGRVLHDSRLPPPRWERAKPARPAPATQSLNSLISSLSQLSALAPSAP
jgi:hypothetical protein